MRKIIRLIVIVIVLVLLAGGGYLGWLYLRANPEVMSRIMAELEIESIQAEEGLSASGFIEAEEVSITAEMGGRIVALHADEGHQVQQGKPLVELDTALLEAQRRQAEAALELAEAKLAQVQAGAQPEAIYQAQAALAQAETVRDGAYQVWQDAQAVLNNPQELEARINAARAQVEVARHEFEAAAGNKDAAEAYMESAGRLVNFLEHPGIATFRLPPTFKRQRMEIKIDPGTKQGAYYQWNTTSNQWWEAWAALNTAMAQYEGAQRNLDNLLAMRDNPQSLKAQVDAAQAEYQVAQATVAQAQAQLDLLQAGATREQVAIFQAQVEQARSALRTLEVQLEKMTLKAPRDGLVVERMVHVGEMATPGAALLTVAALDEVKLTIYIPEDEIGRVKVGQQVQVTVDSYPDEVFVGKVSYIASEAEFTPKNVQTKKERVNMVFAVKIKLPNPDHELKPGMPADAEIEY